MRPTLLLALALWALLGWMALPGASATDCTDSPYVMDSSKTSADLNGVLAGWSNTSCRGTILFTASDKTYQLNDTTYIKEGIDWTLDASLGGEITIVNAKDKKFMAMAMDSQTPGASKLMVRGLHFKGNGTVPGNTGWSGESDGGCFETYSVDITAIDCIFDGFRIAGSGSDGGAILAYNS
jgi:hypothetical protein